MKRLSVLALLVLFAVRPALAQVAAPPSKAVLVCADFETGDLSQLKRHQAAEDSLTIVTKPVRAGKYAARSLLRASDPKVAKGQRAEFFDRVAVIEMDRDYWYGLSIFVPEDFFAPEKSNAVLFQWHTQDGAEGPVLAMRAKGGEWQITGPGRRTLTKLPLKKGVWTDWVVHVRWAATPTGFCTIWKDGSEVLNLKEVVTQSPEKLGPYVKFGQYHSVDETAQNVIYVDEYRVAGSDGSYETVAPAGASARPVTMPGSTR